jgi:hypothetical protein
MASGPSNIANAQSEDQNWRARYQKGGPPGPSGVSAGKKAVCLVDETGEAIGVEVYVAMLGASNQVLTDAPRPSACRWT